MPVQTLPTTAGPNVRAGLTDAPLKGIAANWVTASASGIATSAVPPYTSLRVTWRMTTTKIAVNATSITKAEPFPEDGVVAVAATSAFEVASSSSSEARMAPANCATQ